MEPTGIYLGKDMHTRIEKDNFENIWEWPPELDEKSIKDDVLYTVVYNRSYWDSEGSLMGDSWGQRTKVIAVEETPQKVIEHVKSINCLKDKIKDKQRLITAYKKEFYNKISAE